LHVGVRAAFTPAPLSPFLSTSTATGGGGLPLAVLSVPDPASAAVFRYNEPWRRLCEASRMLTGSPRCWSRANGADGRLHCASDRRRAPGQRAAHVFLVGAHHHRDQLGERDRRLPPELVARAGRVAVQVVDLGRPQVARVELDVRLPAQAERAERDL